LTPATKIDYEKKIALDLRLLNAHDSTGLFQASFSEQMGVQVGGPPGSHMSVNGANIGIYNNWISIWDGTSKNG
jgi:hypothetical protein